jgi:hypothetical protein
MGIPTPTFSKDIGLPTSTLLKEMGMPTSTHLGDIGIPTSTMLKEWGMLTSTILKRDGDVPLDPLNKHMHARPHRVKRNGGFIPTSAFSKELVYKIM